jgi:dihydrofolate reductase
VEGGTTFHFVTGGIHEALDRASQAAGGRDVRIGGGPSAIQQFLRAELIDELHLPSRRCSWEAESACSRMST